MIFQQDEYFKEYNCSIENAIKHDIFDLCSAVSKFYDEVNINKFTVILGNEDRLDVTITNDSNRVTNKLGEIETSLGTAIITNTKINKVDYSDIPIVFIKGNQKFQQLITYLRSIAQTFIPKGYDVGTHKGSMYIIFNKDFIGKLWNIHTDAFPTKAHLTLTECEEEFVWYKQDNVIVEQLKNNKFYMFNVRVPHTVNINKYINTSPRIHVVYDINQLDQ